MFSQRKTLIIVNRKVPPVMNSPRRITASLKIKLNKELDRMFKMENITHIEEPTDCVSSLVIKLNGQLRICLDPWHLIKLLNFYIS